MENHLEILLVEDNPYDAELALRALKQNNLVNHIIHLSDGEEALDFLFAGGKYKDIRPRQIPRLILLDLKLPGLSGLEVLKQLKADPVMKTVPVVMLTSSREEKDVIESYNLGANSYLVKPVDFNKFTDVIKDLGFYWLVLNVKPNI